MNTFLAFSESYFNCNSTCLTLSEMRTFTRRAHAYVSCIRLLPKPTAYRLE